MTVAPEEKMAKKAARGKLSKEEKKEIKKRLWKEVVKESRPIAVGTAAMIGSSLCNQGMLWSLAASHSCACARRVVEIGRRVV